MLAACRAVGDNGFTCRIVPPKDSPPENFPPMTRLLQRRSFLGLGMAGGLSLWAGSSLGSGSSEAKLARAKSVLLIYEQGGLSHIDTWDPKPEIPVDHRSPHSVIATKVAGMQFTHIPRETLPERERPAQDVVKPQRFAWFAVD